LAFNAKTTPFWLENKMKPLFSRSRNLLFKHSHNGFWHYDYVRERSSKNSMFFSQYDKISPKNMADEGPKYKKNLKSPFKKKLVITAY
jgi:hypothetical protein